MMNFVGIINGDSQVVEKIVASQAHHKKIDGHAPGPYRQQRPERLYRRRRVFRP